MPLYSEKELFELRQAYGVLQVEFEASALVIKQAYRRMAQRWHPDKWPADSPEQRQATEKMSRINSAYRLIRHAPLRYHVSTHPKISEKAATQRKAESSRPAPEYARINDRAEYAIRFAFGAVFGLLVAAKLALLGLPGAAFYLVGAPLVCGWLAMRYGDDFWYYALERFWWLWW